MYKCCHCETNGKSYIGLRFRLVAHVYKYHLPLDKAPFYCTLCLLRCSTKAALNNHVSRYSRHRSAAREMGIVDSSEYLVDNTNPAPVLLGKDFREASVLESATSSTLDQGMDEEGEFFQDSQPAQKPTTLPINLNSSNGLISVQMTPEMLASFLGQQKPPSTVPSTSEPSEATYTPSYPTNSTSPVPTYSPTPISTSRETGTLSTSSTVISGSAFMKPPSQPTLNTPLLSPENILPQLLGQQPGASEYSYGGEDWLPDELLSLEPRDPAQTSSSTESSNSPAVAKAPEEPSPKRQKVASPAPQPEAAVWPEVVQALDKVLEERLKPLTEGVQQNARAVRCMEKAFNNMVDVLVKINRNIERMGEEQRREHDYRRREMENRRRDSEGQTRRITDEEDRRREGEQKDRRASDTRRERGKENFTMKSVVNKK